MNKSYKSIWNESLGAWVATSELTASKGKSSRSSLAVSTGASWPAGLKAVALVLAMFSGSFAAADVDANYLAGSTCSTVGVATLASQWTCQVPGADGSFATISNIGSTVLGLPNYGQLAIFVATKLGREAIALGNTGTTALNYRAIAIGQDAKVGSLVAGAGDASWGIAIGAEARVMNGFNGIALGRNASAIGNGSNAGDAIAIGAFSTATSQATAIGANTVASGVGAVAIGGDDIVTGGFGSGYPATTASGIGSVAIASGSLAEGNVATSIGIYSSAKGEGSTANGYKAAATGNSSVAMGRETVSTGINSVAVGNKSSTSAISSVAIGDEALGFGAKSIAIGAGAQAKGESSISIGTGNIVSGNKSGAIGDPTTITGAGTYTLGNDNGTVAANESGIFGNNNVMSTAGVTGSRIIGNASTITVSDAFVIGNKASVTVAGGVAIGSGAVASVDKGMFGYDPALGVASTSVAGAWKSTGAAVSVGSGTTLTRQITSVAAGSIDTDAVNVAQLKAASKGLNVTTSKVGTGTVSGTTVTNVAPGETATYTAGNNVAITQVGKEVQIATSMTPSFTTINTTGGATIGGALTVTGPTTLNGGLSMNNTAITNVAAGVNAGDVVNMSQLTTTNTSVTTLANNPLTFTGNTGSVARKLGETLQITGAATTAGTYSGANLKTEVVGNEVQVKMA
ncbi:MAG: YadA-like protein, partial [Polaromonas sp.]|nr:YadA-like protein [Polaromonas sp.]